MKALPKLQYHNNSYKTLRDFLTSLAYGRTPYYIFDPSLVVIQLQLFSTHRRTRYRIIPLLLFKPGG